MDRDKKRKVIAGQRRALADLLAELDENDWERPSLCGQWRVKDVAAHIALTPQSPGIVRILAKGLRARGDLQAVNRDMAVAHADRPPTELVAQLRELADSRRKPAITTLDNLLFDTMVHIQDVAVPLGLTAAMPLDAARGRRTGVADGLALLGPAPAARAATDRHRHRLVRRRGGRGPRAGPSAAAPAHRPDQGRATAAERARHG